MGPQVTEMGSVVGCLPSSTEVDVVEERDTDPVRLLPTTMTSKQITDISECQRESDECGKSLLKR